MFYPDIKEYLIGDLLPRPGSKLYISIWDLLSKE
jgi:hypothetical protein